MTTHTPTPWRVEQDTTLIWGACNEDDNSSYGLGYPVAECRITPMNMSWAKGPNADEGEANAELIVKAVNSYADLFAEREEMVKALKHIQRTLRDKSEKVWWRLDMITDDVDALLSRIEGERT